MKIIEFTMDFYNQAYKLWQSDPNIGLSSADEEPAVRTFLQQNPGTNFLAQTGQNIVGTLMCGNDGRRGYLYHLYVHPEHRKQGIGQALIDKALLGLKKLGIQKCHLFIFQDNWKGIEFWQSREWQARQDICIFSKPIV